MKLSEGSARVVANHGKKKTGSDLDQHQHNLCRYRHSEESPFRTRYTCFGRQPRCCNENVTAASSGVCGSGPMSLTSLVLSSANGYCQR
jgi:hypothetical protein